MVPYFENACLLRGAISCGLNFKTIALLQDQTALRADFFKDKNCLCKLNKITKILIVLFVVLCVVCKSGKKVT